jgi:hypothetical protein
MRSTLGCGTGSLVNRRTMCLRWTTSAKSASQTLTLRSDILGAWRRARDLFVPTVLQ